MRRQELIADDSYEFFKRVTEEDWGEEIFPKISTKRGNIENAPAEYAVILPCANDLTTTYRLVEKAIERFGGIEDLKRQGKEKGDAALMVHSLGFPDNKGSFTVKSRTIFYPIMADAESKEDVRDDNIVQSLKVVKKHAIQHNIKKIAVPELEGVSGTVALRALQFLFAGTEVEITIFKDQVNFSNNQQAQKRRPQKEARKSARNRPPKTDAILVKMPNTNYVDMLKVVKQNVNPDNIGVDVQDIRKTRTGELLLTVRNGTDKLEALKNEIVNKIPEATTSRITSKKVLHIQDLDEATTTEEVRNAVATAIGTNLDIVEVRALRPTFANKQKVAVLMPETEAALRIKMGKVRIG